MEADDPVVAWVRPDAPRVAHVEAVGLDREVRAAERLDTEVALGARVLAQGARLEAAAVEVALAARVLPHVSAEHLERVRAWIGFGQRVYCWVTSPGARLGG